MYIKKLVFLFLFVIFLLGFFHFAFANSYLENSQNSLPNFLSSVFFNYCHVKTMTPPDFYNFGSKFVVPVGGVTLTSVGVRGIAGSGTVHSANLYIYSYGSQSDPASGNIIATSFTEDPSTWSKANPSGTNPIDFPYVYFSFPSIFLSAGTYFMDFGDCINPSADYFGVKGTSGGTSQSSNAWFNGQWYHYGYVHWDSSYDLPSLSFDWIINDTNANKRNPVLIIPGVLGTDINKGAEKLWLDLQRNLTDIGDKFMDPLQFNTNLTPSDTNLTVGDVIKKIVVNLGVGNPVVFNYTDGLVKEFKNQGYSENKDLFFLPYDWRYGVTGVINGTTNTTEDLLQQKIKDIRIQTGNDKVDIIAHSTGGLLVKKYVVDHQADNHIGKAIFVGVPNTGAPKAIKTLLQGDNFGIPWLADEEMQKISKNLPVVYDLSPSLRYFNVKGSYMKVVDQELVNSTSQNLDFNQTNSFLTNDHGLNSQALLNSHNLHTLDFDNFDMRNAGVDLYSINGCKAGTISKIIERRIKNFSGDISIGYEVPEELPGDGTVPLESATNLPINQNHKYYALQSDHGKMLSQNGILQEIVNIISGSTLVGKDSWGYDLITQDISKCKLKGKAISVFSPLDIDITDQNGNHSGLSSDGVSIENNIPNADFEIMDDHKFVYLPNDEGQIYIVNLKGSGNGTFTVKDQDINDNQVIQTQVFSNIPVTTSLIGKVNLGGTTTLSLDNNGDGIIDQIIQPSSVVNSDQSQDLISPITTAVIAGQMGQSGFYRSNISLNLSAIDPIITGQENQTSGVLKTVYKLDNDSSYTIYTNPILVSVEGKHTLKFFSTDKAGNNEIEQFIDFTIDKTAPEFSIQFDTVKKDLQFTGIDNLSASSDVVLSNQGDVIILTDQAGNFSQIKFKEKNEDKDKEKGENSEHQLERVIKSISYNNNLVNIAKNQLDFNWEFDKKQNLKELDQHIKSEKDFNIEAAYEDGKTKIIGKDTSGKINKSIDGLVLLKINTNKGNLNWMY